MVRVPIGAPRPDTLQRVIEAFVLREGTDYGTVEYDLPTKIAHVMRQLEAGEVLAPTLVEAQAADLAQAA